jgi:hypothetical protein
MTFNEWWESNQAPRSRVLSSDARVIWDASRRETLKGEFICNRCGLRKDSEHTVIGGF